MRHDVGKAFSYNSTNQIKAPYMNDKNLMHINSNNIGLMDTVTDYQRLFINNRIGLESSKDSMKAKRIKVFNLKFNNIDDVWKTLELK